MEKVPSKIKPKGWEIKKAKCVFCFHEWPASGPGPFPKEIKCPNCGGINKFNPPRRKF